MAASNEEIGIPNNVSIAIDIGNEARDHGRNVHIAIDGPVVETETIIKRQGILRVLALMSGCLPPATISKSNPQYTVQWVWCGTVNGMVEAATIRPSSLTLISI